MKILCVDTASQLIHIALLNNGKLISIEKNVELRNYESVIFLIKSSLKRSKIKIDEIDYFGVCIGPGSFTGIRIGLSTMKALAYCMNKPLIGYKSLELHAWMLKDDLSGLLCIMQDARRNNIYSAIFNNGINFHRITPYLLCDISGLIKKIKRLKQFHLSREKKQNKRDLYFYGDILSEYGEDIKKSFPSSIILPQKDKDCKAQAMISLVKNNLKQKCNAFNLLPFYMYPKDCQVSPVRNSGKASKNSLRKLSLIPQGSLLNPVRKRISNGVRKPIS